MCYIMMELGFFVVVSQSWYALVDCDHESTRSKVSGCAMHEGSIFLIFRHAYYIHSFYMNCFVL